jgi:hypothetical protein
MEYTYNTATLHLFTSMASAVFDSLNQEEKTTTIFLILFDPVTCQEYGTARQGNGRDPVWADVDAGRTEMVTLETPSCRPCKTPREQRTAGLARGVASSDADPSGKQATAERSHAVDRVAS